MSFGNMSSKASVPVSKKGDERILPTEYCVEDIPRVLHELKDIEGIPFIQQAQEAGVSDRQLRRAAAGEIEKVSMSSRVKLLNYIYSRRGIASIRGQSVLTIYKAEKLFRDSKWLEAEELYREALPTIDSMMIRNDIYYRMAQIGISTSNYQDAQYWIDQIRPNGNQYIIDLRFALYACILFAKREADALEMMHEALDSMEAWRNFDMALTIQVRLMIDYFYRAELDMFGWMSAKAKATAIHIGRTHWLSVIAGYDGHEAFVKGRFQDARMLYNDALAIAELSDRPFQIARSLCRLGALAIREHNADEAETYLLRAKSIAIERGYRATESCVDSFLALVALLRNDQDKAVELATNGERKARDIDSDKIIESCFILGYVLRHKDPGKSEELLKEARERCEASQQVVKRDIVRQLLECTNDGKGG